MVDNTEFNSKNFHRIEDGDIIQFIPFVDDNDKSYFFKSFMELIDVENKTSFIDINRKCFNSIFYNFRNRQSDLNKKIYFRNTVFSYALINNDKYAFVRIPAFATNTKKYNLGVGLWDSAFKYSVKREMQYRKYDFVILDVDRIDMSNINLNTLHKSMEYFIEKKSIHNPENYDKFLFSLNYMDFLDYLPKEYSRKIKIKNIID